MPVNRENIAVTCHKYLRYDNVRIQRPAVDKLKMTIFYSLSYNNRTHVFVTESQNDVIWHNNNDEIVHLSINKVLDKVLDKVHDRHTKQILFGWCANSSPNPLRHHLIAILTTSFMQGTRCRQMCQLSQVVYCLLWVSKYIKLEMYQVLKYKCVVLAYQLAM